MRFDWDQRETLVSNGGKGPLRARILAVAGEQAEMERWHSKSPRRRTRFSLSLSYLTSANCGWTRKQDLKSDG